MTTTAGVAGLGVNVSRPGVVHPPATATKAGEREATSSSAKTLPAPNPTPHVGAAVRVIGGPYLNQLDVTGVVVAPHRAGWLRVSVRDADTYVRLELRPWEVEPA